jgi:hypothetical protein
MLPIRQVEQKRLLGLRAVLQQLPRGMEFGGWEECSVGFLLLRFHSDKLVILDSLVLPLALRFLAVEIRIITGRSD